MHDEWVVRLKGHAFDLEELSDHFTSDSLNVKKDDDSSHYLRSSDFDRMAESDAVRERAQDLIMFRLTITSPGTLGAALS